MSARDLRLAGTVLHVRDFGEAHRIVEVLTAEQGRIAAVARNARGSRRRFGGVLDVFAGLELEATIGPGLWTLRTATLRDARLGLRADLDRLAGATLCCEAVRLLVPEHQPAPEVHLALGDALDDLARGDLARAVRFYPRLFAAAGISPDLELCVRCGQPAQWITGVDADLGGMVCAGCAPARRPLTAATIAALAGAPCPDDDTARAVERLGVDWIEAQTGRPLRSRVASLRP